jgi:hypothetical protein
MPVDKSGFGGNIIFIDTENTFRAERIFQIAEHRGINEPDEILRKIYVCKIYNTSHLEVIIQNLGKSIEEYKAKLVIVDSIIALHRAEFTGRGTLADRQQRLNIMLHKLTRLAEVHNIAVVITNQVQSQPDDFFAGGDGLRATGGNIMGHAYCCSKSSSPLINDVCNSSRTPYFGNNIVPRSSYGLNVISWYQYNIIWKRYFMLCQIGRIDVISMVKQEISSII